MYRDPATCAARRTARSGGFNSSVLTFSGEGAGETPDDAGETPALPVGETPDDAGETVARRAAAASLFRLTPDQIPNPKVQ